MAKLSLALLILATVLSVSASVLPVDSTNLPAVLLGPKLLSLKSLGHDSTEIHEPNLNSGSPPPPPSLPLSPRANPSALTDLDTCDAIELTRSNILEGINYLISLGSKPCEVGQESVVFVTKGDVAITGYDGLMGGSTSAPCSDVGIAVRWIVSHCAKGPLAFGGTTTARGNKALVIRVRKA